MAFNGPCISKAKRLLAGISTAHINRCRRRASLFITAACLLFATGIKDGVADKLPGVISAGLEVVLSRYIDPLPGARLAADALEGLNRIDPDLAFSYQENIYRLSHRGERITSIHGPDAQMAARWGSAEWSDLILSGVRAARAVSPALQQAGTGEVKNALMMSILASLDHHSRYASADEAARQRDRREGFVGIGIRFTRREGRPIVTEVFPDGPADRAKIMAGDLITHVDGQAVSDKTTRELADLLRGRPGSQVEVILERPRQFTAYVRKLRRARVVPPTITYRRDGRIIRLTISGFNRRTGLTLVETLRRAGSALGEDLAGVILDLRGNPGGLLDQGVAVVDAFLTSGLISTTQGRHPDALHRFEASGDDILNGKPLIILINGRTASSGELVAAALQDRGRALLLGSASYGKGSVQSVNELPDQSELIITWSLIHAPSGYPFHRLGVLPTICTANMTDLAELRTRIRSGALPNSHHLTKWRSAGWPLDDGTRTQLRNFCPGNAEKPDRDLALAREILLDPPLYQRLIATSRSVLTAQSNLP